MGSTDGLGQTGARPVGDRSVSHGAVAARSGLGGCRRIALQKGWRGPSRASDRLLSRVAVRGGASGGAAAGRFLEASVLLAGTYRPYRRHLSSWSHFSAVRVGPRRRSQTL